jgi:phosphoserine phosphatase
MLKVSGVALLDMDGTLLSRRTIDTLCEAFGLSGRLRDIDQLSLTLPAYRITEEITKLLRGKATETMERLFDSIPLSAGAEELVDFFKGRNFITAVVTDSYQFLAERLARRNGLDVTYGNIAEIRDGVLTGRLLTRRNCLKIPGCREHSVCKLWFLQKLRKEAGGLAVSVGDGESDVCMTLGADVGIAYRPRSPRLKQVAKLVVSDFEELIDLLEDMLQVN